jgi:methylmalonyl-CoA mutase
MTSTPGGRSDTATAAPPFPVRFVTATALFDGHDASISLVRRLLQRQGVEVVHLGHNRSVAEIVAAVVEEDAHGVAVSSYQGGHMEFFTYLLDQLRAAGRPDVRVFAGGGGVIVPEEVATLEAAGVVKVFTPEDGARLGLEGMGQAMVSSCAEDIAADLSPVVDGLADAGSRGLARWISAVERGTVPDALLSEVRAAAADRPVPVLGVTGTGGSGKSSLTDELLRRWLLDDKDPLRVAVVAVDPSRRRGGGALLGDRIRMNALGPTVFFRSLATRRSASEVPDAIDDIVAGCAAAGYELVVVETPGIGQGDGAVADHAQLSLYVMTPEYGAQSQLEKIDMLEVADVVAINKFDRHGAADAWRDVARTLARQARFAGVARDDLPVFGTVASRFDDDGVTALAQYLRDRLVEHGLPPAAGLLRRVTLRRSTASRTLVPGSRVRYLADVADAVRAHHRRAAEQVALVAEAESLETAADVMERSAPPSTDPVAAAHEATPERHDPAADHLVPAAELRAIAAARWGSVDPALVAQLEQWPDVVRHAGTATAPGDGPDQAADGTPAGRRTLSGTWVPAVAVPRFASRADLARWLLRENRPGRFPYTAGVFPTKRRDEEPTRMFAGEGEPARTNRRFHLLADGMPAVRLSTAFDSVTLYGFDPDERPDIHGKIGNAGVSVATIEDMAALYAGFDLAAPNTSVSMTINGPAPTILAMFLNVAIDQGLARAAAEAGRDLTDAEAAAVRAEVLRTVRGTVQADILKEDQGQNTCIFSTDFALRAMTDVQEWFVAHQVRNFYSVSISGYHIAEAGANPITQLAFTLANAFTYVEAYLARGMAIDDFAPNLSFFFSAGMDPEYSVLGRVARRIWAIALRDRYGANERSQRLKYHVQTSGRSLHAQEMAFNDIRTTLQALEAIYDNCNSLHTNAYDEAVTTPTEESVRRAMAIQLIINREWGLTAFDNPLQGSFAIEQLTDAVEAAVLDELDRLSERGGVLGAMELGYQRGRIQDESLVYEQAKHDGSLPIIGVNTFRRADGEPEATTIPLARSTDDEKRRQLERLADFHARHATEAPAALARLREVALAGGNLFDELMSTVRVCSLGQITQTLFDVGGRYRRNL